MAHFDYKEMIQLINLFQLDVRMQKLPEGQDCYLLTEKQQTTIIADFRGHPISGYKFTIYENNQAAQKKA